MSEEELEQHGNQTLNESGACLLNPFAEVLAVQQQVVRSAVSMQLALAQGVTQAMWRTVLK